MKAALLHRNGDPTSPDVLSVEDGVPVPTPGPGQVLVRVYAASINPIDWKLARGDIPGQKKGTLGSDVCGVVVATAAATTTSATTPAVVWKAGDVIYADAIATKGSFAEYMVVDARVTSKKPSNLTFAEAASLPLAGLTALQGLRTHGELVSGQKVLILGGSGGVGSLAIQMAKALGASHVAATGSDVSLIRDTLGADEVVNYKTESLIEKLGGRDFDIVYDTIGGYEHWVLGQAALKPGNGGIYVTLVADNDASFMWSLAKVAWRMMVAKVWGGPKYRFFLCDTKSDQVGVDMTAMTEMVESGKVKPLLDERRFKLTTDGVHDMVKASMSHRTKGKLILQVVKE